MSAAAAPAALADPLLRASLFEDAVGALQERRVGAIVELCRAAGPQLLKMQTARKGNTMLHLAPSAQLAEVLLCLGADALALNAEGQTARECAAPDNAALVAVLHAAESEALRRAPCVPSGGSVALAAAEGDEAQVLVLLQQTQRVAEASAAAERCAQLWGSLEDRQLAAATQHFADAGLTPPSPLAAAAPSVAVSQEEREAPPVGLDALQKIETMMGRTVELVEALVVEDRGAREQASLHQQLLHTALMDAARSIAQNKHSGPGATGSITELANAAAHPGAAAPLGHTAAAHNAAGTFPATTVDEFPESR